MAGVKYIKKTPTADAPQAAEPTPAGRKSTRQKATPEVTKPAANTKAKVTKKGETNEIAAMSEATPKKRGRPSGADSTASAKSPGLKANGEPRKKPGPKPKSEPAAPVEKKATSKRKRSEEPVAAPAKKAKVLPKGPVINTVPQERLDVYVFGEGSSGELGLGTSKKAIDVKRPRLNPNLAASAVGVVQLAAGGMHVIALTAENKLLTWGVNDQGALGRDTAWDGGLKDMDDDKSDDSDDSDDDAGLNPRESTPTAIPSDKFPEDTVFVQVAAGDSTSFAVTDDGHVYGWGTFRSNEGIFGFSADVLVQRDPILVPGLKNIKKVVCGANHVLALDAAGAVFAWGSGQQNQLGRRVVERTKTQGLIPREFGLPRKAIKDIECGAYHSFAIDNKDRVWAWGLNNYGETGIVDSAGEDDAVVLKPAVVEALSGKGITCIKGGGHHSIAVIGNGDCLTWGRVDGNQIGVPTAELPEEDIIKDERQAPRILKVPTKVTAIKEPVVFATAGSEHCIAVTKTGQAYSWGFSANYQTGQGTDDDITVATLIDNTAVRGKKLDKAYAGGQYSMLTAPADEGAGNVNGVNGTAH